MKIIKTLSLLCKKLFLISLFALTCSSVWADFTGVVVKVVDGDTIDVLVDKQPVRVRLAQIDAPERNQAFGTRSKQALAAMIFKKHVTVVGSARDRHGRTVGTVYVDGADINRAMVGLGMAWVHPRYVKDQSLFAVQAEAAKQRRGLWVDPEPVAPWLFRKR